MYIPKAFEGSDAVGREIMQAHGLALLVTADAAGAPLATREVATHSSPHINKIRAKCLQATHLPDGTRPGLSGLDLCS